MTAPLLIKFTTMGCRNFYSPSKIYFKSFKSLNCIKARPRIARESFWNIFHFSRLIPSLFSLFSFIVLSLRISFFEWWYFCSNSFFPFPHWVLTIIKNLSIFEIRFISILWSMCWDGPHISWFVHGFLIKSYSHKHSHRSSFSSYSVLLNLGDRSQAARTTHLHFWCPHFCEELHEPSSVCILNLLSHFVFW